MSPLSPSPPLGSPQHTTRFITTAQHSTRSRGLPGSLHPEASRRAPSPRSWQDSRCRPLRGSFILGDRCWGTTQRFPRRVSVSFSHWSLKSFTQGCFSYSLPPHVPVSVVHSRQQVLGLVSLTCHVPRSLFLLFFFLFLSLAFVKSFFNCFSVTRLSVGS